MVMHRLQIADNNVNGVSSRSEADPSPGKECHVRQVAPDRQQATVRNKDTIKIGTWNVRTLYQLGKLINVRQEVERLKINILGICESRWKNSGDFICEEYWNRSGDLVVASTELSIQEEKNMREALG